MVIGNKLDIVDQDSSNRKVPEDHVREYCRDNKLHYYETSAKVGLNVRESFEELIERT
jgi:hypothetical protein